MPKWKRPPSSRRILSKYSLFWISARLHMIVTASRKVLQCGCSFSTLRNPPRKLYYTMWQQTTIRAADKKANLRRNTIVQLLVVEVRHQRFHSQNRRRNSQHHTTCKDYRRSLLRSSLGRSTSMCPRIRRVIARRDLHQIPTCVSLLFYAYLLGSTQRLYVT